MRFAFIPTAVLKSCAGRRSKSPEPGPGQVRVRHTAIGLNFIDTYERTGLYPLHAAGRARARGRGRRRSRRPAASSRSRSATASPTHSILPARTAKRACCPPSGWCASPKASTIDQAAALMLKGMTAQMLLRQTYRVRKGQHAARACRGRRRRLDPRAVGEASRRKGHRGRRLGQPKRSGRASSVRTTCCCRARIGLRRRKRRPRTAASTWSTTRSARTRSSARSIACGRAA